MNDKISRHQLYALRFLMLLSPLIRLIPRLVVKEAGSAAWASCLLAFIPLCFFIAFINHFARVAGKNNMSDIFLLVFGPLLGRVVLAIYSLWLLLYTGYLLQSSADRFMSTVYPSSGPVLFIGVMLILSVIAASGRVKVLARTCEIFRALLLAVFIFVFVFSIPNVDINNLLPVSTLNTVPVLKGLIPLVNMVGVAVYTIFLERYIRPEPPKNKPDIIWMGVLILLAAALCIMTIGLFGAELVEKMTNPFFVMLRNISVFNVLERIEALIIVLWVFTDFIIISVILRIACDNIYLVSHRCESDCAQKDFKWFVFLGAAIAALCAIFMPDSSFELRKWTNVYIQIFNAIFVYGVFPVTYIVGKLRKRF